MRYVLLIVALLWALPATAWNDCGVPAASTTVGGLLTPKVGKICHDTAIATATDSQLLSIQGCDHIQIDFDPAASSTNTGAQAQLYSCTVGAISGAWCKKMLVDVDGDGIPDDVTLDGATVGRNGQQWQNAYWIYVDMTVAPSGTDISRTMITCH